MKRQFLKGLGIQCIAIATLFATPNMTPAQTQYVEQVRNQLNNARDILEARGFEKTHDYKIATLANGSARSTTLNLEKGMQYAIIGVCDKDCTDLDIKLYDENDKQVASDTSADDKPLVSITPRWTGQFRILVSMYKCSNSPCYYGVGVFGK
jgi:hypothetical protein